MSTPTAALSRPVIDPVLYDPKFQKIATESLSKIYMSSNGKTTKVEIKSETKTYTVSIAVIVMLSELGADTYSMWDHSAAALACLQTNTPPITRVEILAFACDKIYISTAFYDPFKSFPKPYTHLPPKS